MHDLTIYPEADLIDRFEELQRGPLNFYEAVAFRCACDENCAWDDIVAIEGELVRRELETVR